VKNFVASKWKPVNNDVKVEKIFEVHNSRDAQIFESNRKTLAEAGSVEKMRTFYSSQCICNLGHLGSQLCNALSCGICTVVKSSFKSFAFDISHDTGRYGKGIYSNMNPAEADRFSTSSTSSPYRVMVLCDVIMYKKAQVLPIRRPELATDGTRVFVNSSDSIIVRYVILYTK